MKSRSLARVLPVLESFDAQHLASPRIDTPRPELHVVPIDEPESPPPAVVDTTDSDRQHWQDGYEAGVAIGRAQARAEIVDHDVLLRASGAAARTEGLAEQSERIAIGVEKALGVIEGEICAVAARVLSKLVRDKMLERALNEFAGHVKTLLRDGEAGIVTVYAPEDLIERLSQRLGPLAAIKFVAHEETEVWVRSGPTIIETRLDAWRADHFGGE